MMIFLSMIDTDTDKTEFERLYHQYADAIFRKTLYILKNQQDTEDVIQETWLKVSKNMDKLKDKDDRVALAYIMKIAYHQALSHLREQKIPDEPLSEADAKSDEDALFCICQQADMNDIVACFAELPVHYRDVLSLYFFYHHSIPEIAKLLHIKPATANSRFTRGRKKLIDMLERKGFYG